MTPEARSACNAYMREWRKNHPEKNREYKEKYWERRAQQLQDEASKRGNSREEIQPTP